MTINKAGGPADVLDNFPAAGLQDYTDATREYKPSSHRTDYRLVLAYGAVVAGLLFVLWVIYSLWKLSYCWGGAHYTQCQDLDSREPLVVQGLAGLLALGAVAWVTLTLWSKYRMTQAMAARVATTYNRWGDPERVDTPWPLEAQLNRYAMATRLKAHTAQYEMWHATNSWSPSFNIQGPPALEDDGGGDQVDVGPLPPDLWLPRLNTQPHIILAAKTGKGKSTLAKTVLAPRLEAGEPVLIIDPHSSDWWDLPAVGGGEDWNAVEQAMMAVLDEYRDRMAYRARYKKETGQELPHDHFTRLTVLVDEGNSAQGHFAARYYRAKGDGPWVRFCEVLGSGARKVGVSVILLVQSPLVEDLGISGGMRENFTRLALDHRTARQMIDQDERDPARRAALVARLQGQEFPALMEWDGQVVLLDRTGLAQPPTPRVRTPWDGWDYEANRPSVCPAARASRARGATPLQTDRQTGADDYKATLVVGLKRAGLNRDQIRAELHQLGLGLDSNEYGRILRAHGIRD